MTDIKTHIDNNIIPDNTDYKELYLSLIYLVSNKYPGETRHETAARYITEAENKFSGPHVSS
jgi:hypothetical protein